MTLWAILPERRVRALFRRLKALGLMLCAGLMIGASCNAEPQPLNSPRWLNKAINSNINEGFVVAHDDDDAEHTLHALGFSKISKGRYVRRVDLLTRATLVPSAMADLPEIDAIAVITINRPFLGDKQYAYDTLRSLFAELPGDAHINMLVGNADVSYLNADILAREIGINNVSRVHITPAPKDVAEFFIEEAIAVRPRAAWNFARALRSYNGTKHLLLLEDDISLARGSMQQLRPYLNMPPVSIFTLFNDRCSSIEPTWRWDDSTLAIGAAAILRNYDFPTTQAIIFSADVANDAGEYLITRAGRESYDYMLGRFFAQTQSTLGYVQPSIAQHEGHQTTGLSDSESPWSTCYEPVITPISHGG